MQVASLDHLVLTVKSIPESVDFYCKVLGMREQVFTGNGVSRIALKFGNQKINLHEVGNEFLPGASRPLSGTGDLCFLTDDNMGQVLAHLKQQEIEIVDGPVERTGATGRLLSVYIRDPDLNLIEISNLL
ncbi:MAG: VOC family protein [Acidiferrobacterales bacterium]|nr:VOC family protein [Acidiferrobacterales bacterium]